MNTPTIIQESIHPIENLAKLEAILALLQHADFNMITRDDLFYSLELMKDLLPSYEQWEAAFNSTI